MKKDKEFIDEHTIESLGESTILFHAARPKVGPVAKLDEDGNPYIDTDYIRDDNGKVIHEKPTHTLVFVYDEDNNVVFMSWAQAMDRVVKEERIPTGQAFGIQRSLVTEFVCAGDAYCKKIGRRKAVSRMKKILDRFSVDDTMDTVEESLPNVLPSKVVETLDYYLEKVAFYFRLDGTQDLITVGDRRTQETKIFTSETGPHEGTTKSQLMCIDGAFAGFDVDDLDDEREILDPVGEEESQNTTETNETPQNSGVTIEELLEADVGDVENSKWIFCTIDGQDHEGKPAIVIVIQKRKEFIKQPVINLEITDELMEDVDEIVTEYGMYTDGTGDSRVLYQDQLKQDVVIDVLKGKGFVYSNGLEATYLGTREKTHDEIGEELKEAKANI